jgi:hypothetical protein
VIVQVGANYQALTSDYLKGQTTLPKAGFEAEREEKKP